MFQNNTSAAAIEHQPVDKILRLEIDASNVFRYYTQNRYFFTFKISELKHILDDMDESCLKFLLCYHNRTKILSFTLYDDTNGARIIHQISGITLVKGDEFYTYETLIQDTILNNRMFITNIYSENLKKILGKTCRKLCSDVDLELVNNICQLTFKQPSKNDHHCDFDSTSRETYERIKDNIIGKKFVIVRQSDQPFSTKYPNIDIHKFILHFKDMKMQLDFSDTATVANVNSDESKFIFYIPNACQTVGTFC